MKSGRISPIGTPVCGKEHRNVIVFKDETIVPMLRNISSSAKVSPLNSARKLLSKETMQPLDSQTNFSEINTEV